MHNNNFWLALDTLITTSELIIDRPRGSAHPRYPTFHYPLDYGYLKGTHAGDGDGIDVWVGGSLEKNVTGVILTVDLLKRDSEIKILLGCTREEMQTIGSIHQKGMQAAMLVER